MTRTPVILQRAVLTLAMLCASDPLMHAEIRYTKSGPGKGYKSIPGGAYSVVAEVHAKPGKEEELRRATLPLINLVRSDPKNLVYFFQVDRSDPGHLIFYEVFATQADFEAHNNMPYVRSWFNQLPDLADGGVKVLRMEVLRPPSE